MSVEFLAEAEEEFADAALFYEEQQEFLGERFVAAVQDTLARFHRCSMKLNRGFGKPE